MKDKTDNGHIGTTSKGIGPTYSAKYNRTGLRLIDVQHAIKNKNLYTLITDKYKDYTQYYTSGTSGNNDNDMKEAIIHDIDNIIWVIETFNIVDPTFFKREMFSLINKHYVVEASNATLLDINYGTYPYVTSSSCITSNMFSSLCLTPNDLMSLDCEFIGVVKSYPTRVGAGILPTEIMDKSISEKIIEGGAEFGVTTGRRRRPGWPDCVIINYANMVNGFNHINLTRLDNLSQFDKIMICISYLQDEESGPLSYFPYHHNDDLSSISPQYLQIEGWKDFDFTKVKKWTDLHPNVMNFIRIIEKFGNVEVKSVNTGQELGMIVFKE
jgi:adenylosuccinate synthase